MDDVIIEKWISRGKILNAKYLILFFNGDYFPQFAQTSRTKNEIVKAKALGKVKRIIEL